MANAKKDDLRKPDASVRYVASLYTHLGPMLDNRALASPHRVLAFCADIARMCGLKVTRRVHANDTDLIIRFTNGKSKLSTYKHIVTSVFNSLYEDGQSGDKKIGVHKSYGLNNGKEFIEIKIDGLGLGQVSYEDAVTALVFEPGFSVNREELTAILRERKPDEFLSVSVTTKGLPSQGLNDLVYTFRTLGPIGNQFYYRHAVFSKLKQYLANLGLEPDVSMAKTTSSMLMKFDLNKTCHVGLIARPTRQVLHMASSFCAYPQVAYLRSTDGADKLAGLTGDVIAYERGIGMHKNIVVGIALQEFNVKKDGVIRVATSSDAVQLVWHEEILYKIEDRQEIIDQSISRLYELLPE